MARQLTRQALFDLIWETPMKQLAVEFGVTPQAISKLCDEFDIPKSGYGYWTLRDMGRPVDKPSLSVEARPAEQAITIEAKAPRTSKPPPAAKAKKPEIAPSSPAEPELETAMPRPEPSQAVIQKTLLDPPPLGSARRKQQLLAQLAVKAVDRGIVLTAPKKSRAISTHLFYLTRFRCARQALQGLKELTYILRLKLFASN